MKKERNKTTNRKDASRRNAWKKVEELSEKVYETKVKNEVEDDQEDIGAYYLYVVCANDTYENIAKAYNMDEKVIRDYNNNLSLDVGQILIIPYDSKTDTNKVWFRSYWTHSIESKGL